MDAERILSEKSKELSKCYGICAVSLCDYGLNEIDMNKQKNKGEYNRIYSKDGTETAPGFKATRNFINYHGGIPYYAPLGWRRWAIDIELDAAKFDEMYKDWPVHGTKPSVVNAILEDGFIPSKKGCWLNKSGEHGVYISPSVNYAALYPMVEDNNSKVRKILEPRRMGNKWVKMVLQVRVKKDTFTVQAGTVPYTLPNDPQFDPNYKNTELEWLLRTTTNINFVEKDRTRSVCMESCSA